MVGWYLAGYERKPHPHPGPPPPPPPGNAAFQPLLIGGGGFVTGISQANDGTQLVRTDTAFLYIRPNSNSPWTNILTGSTVPISATLGPNGRPNCYMGIGPNQGFSDGGDQPLYDAVLAPSDSTVRYMLHFGTVFKWNNGTNKWDFCNYPNGSDIWISPFLSGNDPFRTAQKPMAVHPTSSNTLVISNSGITSPYFTTDGGTTWTLITSVPSGFNRYVICFDPVTPTTIYIAVWGKGVYQSTTGLGAGNFSLIANSPLEVSDMVVNGGVLFLACKLTFNPAEGAGSCNSLYSYPGTGTTWTLKFDDSTHNTFNGVHSVDVDPFNANHMAASDNGLNVFISSDAGSTWSNGSDLAAPTIVVNSASTSAGNNILTFTSVPSWISQITGSTSSVQIAFPPADFLSMPGYQTIRQVLAAGNTTTNWLGQHNVASPASSTSTTITLTQNAVGTINAGDQIGFSAANGYGENIPWLIPATFGSGGISPCAVRFDAAVSGRLIFTGGTGVWLSDSYTPSNVNFDVNNVLVFKSTTSGIENLSCTGLVAAANGVQTAVMCYFWDFGVIKVAANPAVNYPPGLKGPTQHFARSFGLDCAKDGSGHCVNISAGQGWWTSGYSGDFGDTWDTFSSDITLGNGGIGPVAVSTSANACNVQLSNGFSLTITNITNNGGLVHITAANSLINGQTVFIRGVTGSGAGNVNGNWVVAGASGTAFDLTGSTFTGAPTGGTVGYPEFVYTTNLTSGASSTWQGATTSPPLLNIIGFPNFGIHTFRTDQVTALKYYWYNSGQGLWISTDGGINWSQVTFASGTSNSTTINSGTETGFDRLKTVPGVANKLYYTGGLAIGNPYPLSGGANAQPLKVSTDGGANWSTVTGIWDVVDIGFGQPINGAPPTSGNPATIWVMGSYTGGAAPTTFSAFLNSWGVYRSTDGGTTWVKKQTNSQFWPNDVCILYMTVDGDPNDYKKVYFTTFGNGYVFGSGFA